MGMSPGGCSLSLAGQVIETHSSWMDDNGWIGPRYNGTRLYQSMQSCSPWSPGSLQWRHDKRDGVPNHRRLDCLLNHLFRRSSKKASKLSVIGLCECTGDRWIHTENISIWWRHHGDMACGNIDGSSDVYFSYCSVGITSLIKAYPFRVMIRSWRGNTFRINGHLRGESTGHLWITLQSADNTELWWSLWCSLNNLLNKQPYCRWFETLWRTCCVILIWNLIKTILYESSTYPSWNKKWNEIFPWYWCNVHYQETVSWWRHQMETFPASLAICSGIHRSPVNFTHKGQWRGALMFCLICVWINGWVNNRDAGDLRRYRAHCDVSVMLFLRRFLYSMLSLWACRRNTCIITIIIRLVGWG